MHKLCVAVLLVLLLGVCAVATADTLEAIPAPFLRSATSDPLAAPAPASGGGSASLLGTPPASFDLRSVNGQSYVTSVKNQGSAGTCWTFATYGSLESSILMAGGTALDFSENNLARRHGFDLALNDGGQYFMSSAYLARWSGPISEVNDPYSADPNAPPDTITGPVEQTVREITYYDTAAEVKNALMTQGALATSFYWNAAYYNSSAKTYYYSGSAESNHGVTIVGWDNNKVTAGGTGAWLIKNSWGTSWGSQGYFWIAYQDSHIATTDGSWSFHDAVPFSASARNYSYDPLGWVSSLNTPYAMNAFVAQSWEALNAVGFYTTADNAHYSIQIYDSFDGDTLDGLLASAEGAESFIGYHTVTLDDSLLFSPGDDFYVVVYLTNSGTHPQAFEYAYGGYSSLATALAGQSFYSFNGLSWTDLTTFDNTANFTIKAFTTIIPEPASLAFPAIAALLLLTRRRR